MIPRPARIRYPTLPPDPVGTTRRQRPWRPTRRGVGRSHLTDFRRYPQRHLLRLATVAIALTFARAEAAPLANRILEVPLLIRVALCPPASAPARSTATPLQPVRSEGWVNAHLRAARELFHPHGIELKARVETFRPPRCELLDATQRDSVAFAAPPSTAVTVLVVRRVRDLDVPSYNLMGVHWRYRGHNRKLAGRRWVLLTARAKPPVLAHELAHFFGLPHDPRGGNLMTPGPSSPLWQRKPAPRPFAPRLTTAQARRLRQGIRHWLRARLVLQ